MVHIVFSTLLSLIIAKIITNYKKNKHRKQLYSQSRSTMVALNKLCNNRAKALVVSISPNRAKPGYKGTWLYFVPIWLLIILRWDMAPDTTYGTGSYYRFCNYVSSGGTLASGRYTDEPLSWGFIAFLSKLDIPWILLLAVLGSIYVVSFILYFKHLCINPMLSLLFFCLIGLISFSFGALRQILSLSFLLYAYCLALEQTQLNSVHWIKILLALILGGLCHTSCFFMIPFFIISNSKIDKDKMSWMVIFLAVTRPLVGKILSSLLNMTRFATRISVARDTFAPTFVILGAVILILMKIFFVEFSASDPRAEFTFKIMLCFELAMIFSDYFVDAYRMLHLFSPLMIIEIPNFILSIKSKQLQIGVGSIILFVFLIFFVHQNSAMEYKSVLSMLPQVLRMY